ncbi:uncharacterized protein LOC134261798, partial [Saccostrea cucullata]|uniref:uncharacterized protein LOC134229644 n=1 Tax=Saccostrea cuccullata TaxID=36930 RepID=UPI002ED0F9F5
MMAPGRFVFLCLVLLLGVCYGQPPQSDAGTGLVAGSLGLGLITLAGLSASNAVLAGQVQNLRRNCNAADCSDCEEKLKKCLEEKERIQKDLIETENDLEEAKETIDLQTTTIQNLNQQVA